MQQVARRYLAAVVPLLIFGSFAARIFAAPNSVPTPQVIAGPRSSSSIMSPSANVSAGSAAVASSLENSKSRDRESERLNRGDDAARPTTKASASNRENVGDGFNTTRIGLSLLLVLGIIVASRFGVKKLFPAVGVGRNSNVIRVISRSVVGPKQQFLLVQVGQRLILVGDSGTAMNALTEIREPTEVAALVGQLQTESAASSSSAFGALFKKAGQDFNARDIEQAKESADETVADTRESDDVALVSASNEITGLMDQVRMLAKRVR